MSYKRSFNIVFTNGKKYRAYTDGRCEKRLCCIFKGCSTLCYNLTEYCGKHKNGEVQLPKPKKIKQYTTIEIKGQIIHIDKKGQKFKLYDKDKNSKRRVCMFNECTSLIYRGLYCKKHEDGNEYAKISLSSSYIDDDGLILHNNQEYRDKCKKTTEIGDATEKYVLNILKENTELECVERIGQSGDKIDITYKFKSDNIIRGIQVKTLHSNKRIDVYRSTLVRNKTSYHEDTLIVLVNKERNRFGLIFYKDCPKTGINLSFRSRHKSKYKNNMFIDFDSFKKELFEMMKSSVEYKESISFTAKKEKESIQRLKNICEEKGLEFKMSDTSTSIFDCCINTHKIQCKLTNQKHGLQYSVSLSKSGICEDFKQSRVKYHEDDDIDFFIFEIEKYPGNFYIVSKQTLIDKKIILTKNNKGKLSIQIPPVGYTNTKSMTYWMLEHINRFELLQ